MATKKSVLLQRLASAKEQRTSKTQTDKEPLKAPQPEPEVKPEKEMGIITNPQRELAAECTRIAMIAGWDKAIQQVAYENRISEDRMKELLDEAVAYQDKADPSGRIEGIEDWTVEKRGSSTLARTR